jgi:hypothetical protein
MHGRAHAGTLHMDVANKFKSAVTKLTHPALIKPSAHGVKLQPAVALYAIGDEIEVIKLHVRILLVCLL